MADEKTTTPEDDTEDEITPLFPEWNNRFGHWDAHHRFFISLGVAAAVCVAVPWSWHWPTRAVITWIAYSVSALVMMWYVIVSADPSEAQREASLQDSSRRAIFILVILAAIASVFAVGAELGTAKGLEKTYLAGHILFSLLAIFTSWSLVHTVFTLRYAHIYYDAPEGDDARGGLNFPDEKLPDYLDFAYFSFVIGMCFQTSDVSITSRRLRRLALVHSVISFGFNLAILGLSINMVSGLFS
ncbi:MAG: DUF1345 domain-containing protein [Gluconacetobacter diazotrophicus]|nr:DUF1345 domain-containing protein [Gluconacetobacter diazotrophicus]